MSCEKRQVNTKSYRIVPNRTYESLRCERARNNAKYGKCLTPRMVRDAVVTQKVSVSNVNSITLVKEWSLFTKRENAPVKVFAAAMKMASELRETGCLSAQKNLDISPEFYKNLANKIMADSKTVENKILCNECLAITSRCPLCKYRNSDLSIEESVTLDRMRENIYPITDKDGKQRLECRLLFKGDPKELYAPEKSNWKNAMEHSMRLWQRLRKNGRLKEFQELIDTEVKEGFAEVIPAEQDADLPTYYSTVGFSVNAKKGKLRFINNHSYNGHPSGSINSNSLAPPDLSGSPWTIMVNFMLWPYAFTVDVKAAYKMMANDVVSNNLRRFYFTDKYTEGKTTVEPSDMKVFRPVRTSFGSALSSGYLDLARTMYVAPAAKLPEAQKSISDLFYVDDGVGIAMDDKHLRTLEADVRQAFAKYGFELKPAMFSDQVEEETGTFLGMTWKVGGGMDHTKPNIYFQLLQKKYNTINPELTHENVHLVVVNMKLGARVLGVLFSYLHVAIAPAVATAKCLYAELCPTMGKDWNTPVLAKDPDLHKRYMAFINSLIGINDRLKAFPRAILPSKDHQLERIIVCVDAGKRLIGSGLWCVSRNRKTNKRYSKLVMTKNNTHKLSIAKAEMSAYRQATNLLRTFLDAADLSMFKFEIVVLSDSEAGTFAFNPMANLKCVLQSNVVHIVRKFFSDYMLKYKTIQRVRLGFIDGLSQPADPLTKPSPDPISVANSDYFRHGPKFFLDEKYPAENDVFLTLNRDLKFVYKPLRFKGNTEKKRKKAKDLQEKIEKGEKPWWAELPPSEKSRTGKSEAPMDNDYESGYESSPGGDDEVCDLNQETATTFFVRNKLFEKARSGYTFKNAEKCIEECRHCDEKMNQFCFTTRQSSKECIKKVARKHDVTRLPVMCSEFYEYVTSRYSSLKKTLSLLAYLHKWMPTRCPGSGKRGTKKENILFVMFLKIIKTHQAIYADNKSTSNVHTAISPDGIITVKTRRPHITGSEEWENVYLVPVLYPSDDKLLSRVLHDAHVVTSSSNKIYAPHRDNQQTKIQVRYGRYAVWVVQVGRRIRNMLKNCATCNRFKAKFMATPSSALRYWHSVETSVMYSHISIDLVGPLPVIMPEVDKEISVYSLVVVCLKTMHVSMIECTAPSLREVERALGLLQLMWTPIEYVLCDAAKYFTALRSDSSVFNGREVKIECAPASCQLYNSVELLCIKPAKRLISTSLYSKGKSSFPKMTTYEARNYFAMICNILNMRSLYACPQDSCESKEIPYVSPHLLATTFMKESEADRSIMDKLSVFNRDQKTLLDTVTENREFKEHIMSKLSTALLNNDNMSYRKAPKSQELDTGDIVMVKRQQTALRLAQVIKMSKNKTFAVIKLIDRNKAELSGASPNILAFVHRSRQAKQQVMKDIESNVYGDLNLDDKHFMKGKIQRDKPSKQKVRKSKENPKTPHDKESGKKSHEKQKTKSKENKENLTGKDGERKIQDNKSKTKSIEKQPEEQSKRRPRNKTKEVSVTSPVTKQPNKAYSDKS